MNCTVDFESLDLDGADPESFQHVLKKVNFECLPTFASSVRCSGHRSTGDKSTVISPPSLDCEVLLKVDCGSYHAVLTLSFTDGRLWVLKIPRKGHEKSWTKSLKQALDSEAQTMRLLRQETSIPIPEIHAFDSTLDNELGCPFILMEKVSGRSMYYGWYDDQSSKTKGK